MYVAPAFCPPNLLLAGAMIYELQSCQVKSSQVAIEEGKLDLLLGSLIDGREMIWNGELGAAF